MAQKQQGGDIDKTPPVERLIFGQNVERARTRAGLTQQDIERLGGVSQPFLSAVERGRTSISIDNMARLASLVRVPLWRLLKPDDGSE